MYEELISYILEGYDNSELKKIIQLKKIKIQGVREVNDKTRSIVLRNLKTKNNLFEIYKMWNSQKNKEIEFAEKDEIAFEDIINEINCGHLNRLEGTSAYLSRMIANKGMEESVFFWESNKEELEMIRMTNKIKNQPKENNEDHTMLEKHSDELNKIEKKQNKERQKWQFTENRLNKKILQLSNDIMKLQKERVDIQKKNFNILDELKQKSEELERESMELSSLTLQMERLKSEVKTLNLKNEALSKESNKRNEIIVELKDVIELNIEDIKKLSNVVQDYENSNIVLATLPESDIEKKINNSEKLSEEYSISMKNNDQFMKNEKHSHDELEGEVQVKAEKKKILVFGDITGLNYEKSFFEVYTSNFMPEDISTLVEENYEAIWLVKYRFSKKAQRSQVLKKFKTVKTINNFIELEGAYKNEL